LGAPREDMAVAHDRRAPALAIEHVVRSQFLVGRRRRLKQNEPAVVRQREYAVAHENYLARSEAGLLPFDLASLYIHALHRTGAVLFELKHAVEVSVLENGRAPVIGDRFVARLPINLSRRPLVTVPRDAGGAGPHLVSGGTINDVVRNNGRRGG